MKTKVIINADDFGISLGVNKAIHDLVDEDVITSTSVMSNMPYYKDIIKLKNKIGIGVHFNLTVGKPIVTIDKAATIVNEDGYFYKMSELIKRVRKGAVSKNDVEAELNAQAERLIQIGIKLDHFNSHQSILKYPYFFPIIKKIAKNYSIRAVRTYSMRRFDYERLLNPKKTSISIYLFYQKKKWIREGFIVTDKFDSLLGINMNYNSAIDKLNKIFNDLPNGILEIAVHPGYCSNDNNSMLGIYVNEREVEVNALLSNDFKKIKTKCNFELISFKDIYSIKNQINR